MLGIKSSMSVQISARTGFTSFSLFICLIDSAYCVFTTLCYASSHFCVCVSVYHVPVCVRIAKLTITQTVPHDSPGSLVFLVPNMFAKFECVPDEVG